MTSSITFRPAAVIAKFSDLRNTSTSTQMRVLQQTIDVAEQLSVDMGGDVLPTRVAHAARCLASGMNQQVSTYRASTLKKAVYAKFHGQDILALRHVNDVADAHYNYQAIGILGTGMKSHTAIVRPTALAAGTGTGTGTKRVALSVAALARGRGPVLVTVEKGRDQPGQRLCLELSLHG